MQRMVTISGVQAKDTVLEVGPGPGGLTTLLVESVKRVVAVEYDTQLAQDLPGRVTSDILEVVSADILQYDLAQIGEPYHVVANIPYYLTAKLLRQLLTSSSPPETITLLIQKEVAERLAAKPGKQSVLGVSAQLYADVVLYDVVPAAAFTPAPKVDSQIVRLAVRKEAMFEGVEPAVLMRTVKCGFGEKRKKLSNSLAGGLGVDKAMVAEVIAEAGFSDTVRAQELSLDEWHRLHERLKTIT